MKLAAPAQTGGMSPSWAGRETNSYSRKGNCLSNCRAHVSPTGGCPEAPCQKLCPGRSNKTPRVLRHGHSSTALALPSLQRRLKNQWEEIHWGPGWRLLTTSGSPFADLSFLSAQAASTENIRVLADSTFDAVSEQHQRAEAGHPRPPAVLCFILLFIQVAGLYFIHTADIKHLLGRVLQIL